jgi:hypothetical protein
MTMPAQEPSIERVRGAAMKLAKTGDDDCTAYPERFIIAMTRFEAERWRRQNGDVVTHGLRIPYSRTYH